MKLIFTRVSILLWVGLTVFVMCTPVVEAQNTFSGSDTNNYSCPPLQAYAGPYQWTIADHNTHSFPEVTVESNGNFTCHYTGAGGTSYITNAIIKPPTLKVLQYWFMRILYGAWAISGLVFTGILGYLGFRWLTSRGDPAIIGDVKKRFKNLFIGLVLIFLSYPVLRTVFNVIGVSKDECFSELNLPAFQFFFDTACEAKTGT